VNLLELGSSLDVLIDHRGKTPKKLGGDFESAGVPVASALLVRDGRLDLSQARFVSPELYRKWMPEPVRRGDVILTSEAPAGRVARVLTDDPLVLGQRLFCLRGKTGVLDSGYLYYALQFQPVQSSILGHSTGTTVVGIRQSALRQVRIPAPAFPQQQAIAEVLGALDDKIAANTALVTTSLALVNAEFAQRFGVRALDLPLGEIAHVVDCLHSKKPEQQAEGPTLMQLNNVRDDGLVEHNPVYSISSEDYANWSRRFETRPWDLVITNVGRVGAVARIPTGYVAALGRNMTGIRPRNVAESGSYIAAALKSVAVRHEIDQRTDAGSVMSALNVRNIPLLRLPASSPDERRSFHQLAAPLFLRADQTLRENAALTAVRDALLPHLMSGKLRVRDAEKIAADAGA